MGRPSSYERVKDDFYIEEPAASDLLFDHLRLPKSVSIWDPACGVGTIGQVAEKRGYLRFYSSDKVRRGQNSIYDFVLSKAWHPQVLDWVITNPPYKLFVPFITRALSITHEGVAMLLPLTYLESMERGEIYRTTPLWRVLVFSFRINCPPGERFLKGLIKAKGGQVAYMWAIWRHGFTGEPTLHFLGKRP